MNERQEVVARHLARGYSQRRTALMTGVGRVTIREWLKRPEFAAKVEQIAAQTDGSTAIGTLIDALGSRKDDGVDWPSRIRAALALLSIEDPDEPADEAATGWIT